MTLPPVAAHRFPPQALRCSAGQLLMTVPPVAALRYPPRALRALRCSAEDSSS